MMLQLNLSRRAVFKYALETAQPLQVEKTDAFGNKYNPEMRFVFPLPNITLVNELNEVQRTELAQHVVTYGCILDHAGLAAPLHTFSHAFSEELAANLYACQGPFERLPSHDLHALFIKELRLLLNQKQKLREAQLTNKKKETNP